jgi:hypothetical protein
LFISLLVKMKEEFRTFLSEQGITEAEYLGSDVATKASLTASFQTSITQGKPHPSTSLLSSSSIH